MISRMGLDLSCDSFRDHHLPPGIVSAREILLQPAVKCDEQVAPAHLPAFELGDYGPPVSPSDGQHGPGIAVSGSPQWDLDSKIEVLRKDRAARLDHLGGIGFEGVREVIER